ncbi:epoxide hydrolase family protein [Microbacterium sp. P05]|uniref:epoxide hydrolase family protein n=1 Tax=Microbacterium sp. P05 TaxID=3366948 RepID=UPI00374668B2
MADVASFTIPVDPSELEDLRSRLRGTRAARPLGEGWSDGMDADYLASFVRSWSEHFDWVATVEALNRLPQKLVRLADADVHVFHIRGRSGDPLPLVLTHGWPSSFFEFLPLMTALTDPSSVGGDPADAFDIVIPSLPGFGYSTTFTSGATTPPRIAALWVEVMHALGYTRFGAYGGDIGAHVTNFLGAEYPEHVIGVVTHHPELHPEIHPGVPLSAPERTYLESRTHPDGAADGSYAEVQAGRPATLAAALADSPAGLAAWLLDKYHAWADGDLASTIDSEALRSILTLYWTTNTISTSFLPYRDDPATPALPPVTVPAGILLTPEDRLYPREFAARTYTDIRLWEGTGPGGHFLGLENPDRLVRSLRDFFRPLREHP